MPGRDETPARVCLSGVVPMHVPGAARAYPLTVRQDTAVAPHGMQPFVFAGNVLRAARIITSWDADARRRAVFNLGLDMPFAVAWTSTLGLACFRASAVLRPR